MSIYTDIQMAVKLLLAQAAIVAIQILDGCCTGKSEVLNVKYESMLLFQSP